MSREKLNPRRTLSFGHALCRLVPALVGLSLWAGMAGAQPASFAAGDTVEVREGDAWSGAELVKQEGRKYQIRYPDGTEEWVTTERLRAASAVAPGAGGDTPTGSLKPGRTAPKAGEDAPSAGQTAPARRFRTGQQVQYKATTRWEDGVIKQVAGELYLVGEADTKSDFMSLWMIAETIREPGEDFEGATWPNSFTHRLGNEDRKQSLAKAKTELVDYRRKQAQTVTDETTGRVDRFAALPFDHPMTEADRSQMNEVVSRAASGQPVTPDGVEGGASGGGVNKPFAVAVKAGTGEFFEKVTRVAESGQYGLVGLEDSPPGGASRTAAERLDLATGRSTASAEFDAATVPQDISFDGQHVAAIANGGSPSNRTRVDIWDWSGKQPTHVVSFTPSPDTGSRRGTSPYITDVRWLADGRVAVAESDGTLSAWEVGPGQARGIWSIKLGGSLELARSPGGKQLAVADADGVMLLDGSTGEPLVVFTDLGSRPIQLAFSPSGRYLVLASANQYVRCDLAEDDSSPRIALAPGYGPVIVTDEGHVFARGTLLDGPTGTPLWAYTPPSDLRTFEPGTGTLFGLSKYEGGRRTLAAWPLPHPKAAAALTPGKAPTARNLFAQGSRVSLDLSAMEGDGAAKAQVEQTLTAQLKARGVSVAPGSDVKIVGRTATESEQQQFRERGSSPFGPTETATVTTKTTTLSIDADDRTLWQVTARSGANGAFGVNLNEGDSLQQTLDQQATVNLGPFGSVTLPEIVPAPAEPLGSTELRAGGFGN